MSTEKKKPIRKCEKVQFSLTIFTLRRSWLFEERRRERFSLVLCSPGPALRVPRTTSCPNAGGAMAAAWGVSSREGQCAVLPSSSALMGFGSRAGEGSLFCHFPCCTLSVVKKRLQTPELSIWHFSLALKNNFKIY